MPQTKVVSALKGVKYSIDVTWNCHSILVQYVHMTSHTLLELFYHVQVETHMAEMSM